MHLKLSFVKCCHISYEHESGAGFRLTSQTVIESTAGDARYKVTDSGAAEDSSLLGK
jgi:hypothetical protein